MVRVLAGALLLAVSSAIYASSLPDSGSRHAGADGTAIADALWAPIVLMAIGTVLTWLLVRAPAEPEAAAPDPVHHQHHRRFHL